MALADVEIRQAKSRAKAYKLFDGGGLFLLVHPNGGKYWQLKYRFNGEKIYSLGPYPTVNLADARRKREEIKSLLARGEDPNQVKKREMAEKRRSASNTFEAVALEWLKWRKSTLSERYWNTVRYRLEAYVFPRLGFQPVAKLTAADFLEVFREIERSGKLDLLRKISQSCSAIMRFSVVNGGAAHDVVGDLRGMLKTPKVTNNAWLRETELPEFFSRFARYDGSEQTKNAMEIAIRCFVRTIELRGAKWDEVDFKSAEWLVPEARMKMDRKHLVPLSDQALHFFERQFQISGGGDFIFPNEQHPGRIMSENTLLYALYRMGYRGKATVHGFRATASTILNENEFNRDWIELQLAHWQSASSVRSAYNHAKYLAQRREMVQWYSDHLDRLRASQPSLSSR